MINTTYLAVYFFSFLVIIYNDIITLLARVRGGIPTVFNYCAPSVWFILRATIFLTWNKYFRVLMFLLKEKPLFALFYFMPDFIGLVFALIYSIVTLVLLWRYKFDSWASTFSFVSKHVTSTLVFSCWFGSILILRWLIAQYLGSLMYDFSVLDQLEREVSYTFEQNFFGDVCPVSKLTGRNYQGFRPIERLVCIEPNPGPVDFDGLKNNLENLSLQNRNRFRRPKKIGPQARIDKEINVAKRCLKTAIRQVKLSKEEFSAQMFDFPSVPLKIDEEQYNEILILGKKISSFVETILGPGSSVEEQILEEKAEKVGKAFGAGSVEGISHGIHSAFRIAIENLCSKYGDHVLTLLSIVAIIVLYKKTSSRAQFVMGCGVVILVLGLLKREKIAEGVSHIYGMISNLSFRDGSDDKFEDALEAQMVDASNISDIVTLLLAYNMFPKIYSHKTDLLKFVGDIGRNYTGIESAVGFVLRVLQKILDYVSVKMGFGSFTLMSSLIPKVDDWVSDTRSFLNEMSQGKLTHDQKLYDRILTLEDRAYELLSLYAMDRKSGSIGALVRPLSNELTKIRMLLQQEGVGQYKMRQPPLMISFAGTSQIGKSRMMRPFVARLLSMVLPEEEVVRMKKDFDAHVYSRQPEHEFWDGYCGQAVCFLDEKDLVKESLLTANNANTDIIRMGNVFPNVLHMAGIEQKGNVHFRSKIVVCSTNVLKSSIGAQNAVRYPEAVVNRFHFEVVVRVRREYAVTEDLGFPQNLWRLDKNKLPKDGTFDKDVHEYVLLKRTKNPCRPHEIELEEGEILSFDELLIACAKQYKKLAEESKATPKDDDEAFLDGSRLRDQVFGAQMDDQNIYSSFDSLLFDMETGQKEPKAMYTRLFNMRKNSDTCDKSDLSEVRIKAGVPDELAQTFEFCFSGKLPLTRREQFIEIVRDDPRSFFMFLEQIGGWELERETFSSKIGIVLRRANRLIGENMIGLKLKSLCKWVTDMFHEYSGAIGTIAAMTGLIGFLMTMEAGIKLVTTYIWNKFSGSESQMREPLKPSPLGTGVAQMHDPALEDISMKIWSGNYYSIHFKGDPTPIGYGFFSHFNTFNLCSHYINTWKTREYDDEIIELVGVNKERIDVKVKDFFNFQQIGEDWSQGEIPHTRRHADIRPLMTDASILIRRPTGTIMMIRVSRGVTERVFANYSINLSCHYKDPVGTEYKLPVSMKYDIPTKVGECGLPLFIVDPTTRSKKFVGFHVAGSKVFGTCYVFKGPEEDIGQAQARYLPRTMVEIGSVERPVGTSGVSNIAKSPLYGAWGEPKKAPAKLSSFVKPDGEMVFPMERALMRYDQPILEYDPGLVKACARAAVIANTSNSQFKELPKKVSIEEAVLGVPGLPFMESLNRSTSPGYPWNMKPRTGYKGKERFFGKEAQLTFEGPDWEELKSQVDQAHEMLKRGERPNFLFSDALKDELVKKEKSLNGDTRLFCPSPIVYQILFGIYFKDFLRKMMESRIQGEHAVGVNVYSDEWDMLKRVLTTHGADYVVAGDFKHFDALQAAQILREIGENVIEVFADREYDDIRRLLWMEVWDSKHVVHRSIFQWKQSLPSGHPATTIVNCLFVGTVMRMCWVRANGDDLGSLRRFTELIKLIAYGDDNVLNVAEPARKLFNQHTITELMASFGLTYTPEDKSSDPPAFRNIDEVEFLKRQFRYEPYYGRTTAPLRLETILEMPYWTKKEGFDEIWKGNLENAIRELALHDEETFETWCPTMVEASRQRTGYTPVLVDRKALLDEIVKKEIVYRTQMNDVIPSYPKTLNFGEMKRSELVFRGQKFRKQLTRRNTAYALKPWGVYPYPTKMGCVKQYLGQFRSGTRDRVVSVLRLRLAQNTDNNNMVTELSKKNDMTGTTQILNESGVKTVERASLLDVPGGLLAATRVGYTQSSIYDFLAKPVLLNTLAWGAQAAGDVLLNKSLPSDAFSAALYSNKLDGFLGFRGTTVVRLQVNGNKFQQGRLLMVFIPQGNVASSWPGMRLRSLKAATQLPRVELDLSSETEIIMEIPYISPTPFYNFNDFTGPIGRLAIMVYSPLLTGTGSTEADISLWCHFKDVELVAPAIAQMADRRPKGSKKKNPSEQELAIMGDKPISGGLTHMAKAASSFAKIPLLSSLAGPASWALNCMAGAASAFGYSKPGSEAVTTKVMSLHNFNAQNHNGVDMYPNMGLDASNKLSVMPGYAGTDVDEMSLNHLTQIPSYFDVITMSTSTVAGSVLATYSVHPHLGNTSATVNLWSTRDMTPLSYFSSFFEYWRGSIVFTIKIVKTGFHSGRIMISYNPCSVSPTMAQTDYLLREIIDIRDTTEFRFVVPYTSTTQYKKTHGFTNTVTDSIGYLKFHVLNELVAPDTVSSSIKILVEVSAGPDFELACPAPYDAAPIIVSTWASQMSDVVPASQSSSREDKNQELVAIGASSVEHQSLEPALYCIGERCNSILQLLKRYCVSNYFGSDTPYNGFDVRPFIYGACYSSDPVATPTVFTGDYVSMFGPCFAYSRGSMRALVAPLPSASYIKGPSPVNIYPSTVTTPIVNNAPVHLKPGVSCNWQPDAAVSPTGITVPAYQVLHCRLNRPSTGSTPEPVDIYTSAIRATFLTQWGGAPRSVYFYRAAGDDFSLGYFIGVPLVTTSVTF